MFALKIEEEKLKKLMPAFKTAYDEVAATVCKEILGVTFQEAKSKIDALNAEADKLQAEKKNVIAENDAKKKAAYTAKVAALEAEFEKTNKLAEEALNIRERITVRGSEEQRRAAQLLMGRPESQRYVEQKKRVKEARSAVEKARNGL